MVGIWPLTASKPQKRTFLANFFQFFANLTSPLDYTLLKDLKKVYCWGGSLEARLASNGGHNV